MSSEEGNLGHSIAAGKDHPPMLLISQAPCEGVVLLGDGEAFDTQIRIRQTWFTYCVYQMVILGHLTVLSLSFLICK